MYTYLFFCNKVLIDNFRKKLLKDKSTNLKTRKHVTELKLKTSSLIKNFI